MAVCDKNIISSHESDENYRSDENYCYQLDIRSFALQLFGLELYNGESAIVMEEVKAKIVGTPTDSGKGSTLQMWFEHFCRFDFQQSLISTLNIKALNLGVDLRAFKNKHANKIAGSRTYGISYVYDVEKIDDMLTNMHIKPYDLDNNIDGGDESELVEGDAKDTKKFIKSLESFNMMFANSDAQLLLLKSCRRFIESYCLSGSMRNKRLKQAVEDASNDSAQRRGTITLKREHSLGSSVSNVPSVDTNSLFIGDATSFQMLGILSTRLREIHQADPILNQE